MNGDGIGVAVGTVLCFLSAVCMIVSVRHYRQKGGIFSAVYFAVPWEERVNLRTKKAYRYAARVFLYAALVSAFFGLAFLFDDARFALMGAVLAAGGTLSGLIFIFTAHGE